MNPKFSQIFAGKWKTKKSVGYGLLVLVILAGGSGGMWFFYPSESKKACVNQRDSSRRVSEECNSEKNTKHGEETTPPGSAARWSLSASPNNRVKVLLTHPASPLYFGIRCSKNKALKAAFFIEFSPERVASFKEDFSASEWDVLLYQLLSLKLTNTYFIHHGHHDEDAHTTEQRIKAVQNLQHYLEKDGYTSLYKALQATSEEAHITMANDEYGFKKPLFWKKESDHVFVMNTAQLNKAELSFLLGGISVASDSLEMVFENHKHPTCLIPGFSLPKGLSSKSTKPDENCLKITLPISQAQNTIQTLRSQCGF